MPVGFGSVGELVIVPDGDCLFGVSGVKDCPGLLALDIYKSETPLDRTSDYRIDDPAIVKKPVARIVMDITTVSVVNSKISEIFIEFARRANESYDASQQETANVHGEHGD